MAIKEESPTGCHSNHFNQKEIFVPNEPRHRASIVQNPISTTAIIICEDSCKNSLRKSEEKKSYLDKSIETTRAATPEHFVYGNTARSLMQRSKVISPERGHLSQTECSFNIDDNDCSSKSKSDNDLSPVAQLEKKPNDILERRHSPDDRDKKRNLSEKKQEILTDNSKTTNGRRRHRDDTPSSTGSGDTQFCCPIPTNISLLKLRSKTSKAGIKRKSKENVTTETSNPEHGKNIVSEIEVNRQMSKTDEKETKDTLAPLAAVEELSESFESLTSKMQDNKAASREELPCTEEEMLLSEEGIENLLIVGSFAKDNRRKKIKEKIVAENDDGLSEEGSIPSLELFRSKSIERNIEVELPVSFEEVLTTVISKQIHAKGVSKEKHPSNVEGEKFNEFDSRIDEENTRKGSGNETSMGQTTQEDICTIDNLENSQGNKSLNDETNNIYFDNEPFQFDNKPIAKNDEMSEEGENKISEVDLKQSNLELTTKLKKSTDDLKANQDNKNEGSAKKINSDNKLLIIKTKIPEEDLIITEVDGLKESHENKLQNDKTEAEASGIDYIQINWTVKEMKNVIPIEDPTIGDVVNETLSILKNNDEVVRNDNLNEGYETKSQMEEKLESIISRTDLNMVKSDLNILDGNPGKNVKDLPEENISEQANKEKLDINIEVPQLNKRDADLYFEIVAEIEINGNVNGNCQEETNNQEVVDTGYLKIINESELLNGNTKSLEEEKSENIVLESESSESPKCEAILDSGIKNETVELKVNENKVAENYKNIMMPEIFIQEEIQLPNETSLCKTTDSQMYHSQPSPLFLSESDNQENQYFISSKLDENEKNTGEAESTFSDKESADRACTTPDLVFLSQLKMFSDFSSTSSLETIIDAREQFNSQSMVLLDDITYNLKYEEQKETQIISQEPFELTDDLTSPELKINLDDLVDEGFESIEPEIKHSLAKTVELNNPALFYARECQEELALDSAKAFLEPTTFIETNATIENWPKSDSENIERIQFVPCLVMTFQDSGTSKNIEELEVNKSTLTPSTFLLGGNQNFEELKESKSLVQMTESEYSVEVNAENEESESNSGIEESLSQLSSARSSRCSSIEMTSFPGFTSKTNSSLNEDELANMPLPDTTDSDLECKAKKYFSIPEIQVSFDAQEPTEKYISDTAEDYLTDTVFTDNSNNYQHEPEMFDNQDLKISEISQNEEEKCVLVDQGREKIEDIKETLIFACNNQSGRETSSEKDLTNPDVKNKLSKEVEILEEATSKNIDDEIITETIPLTEYSEISANLFEDTKAQEPTTNDGHAKKKISRSSETSRVVDKEMLTEAGFEETKNVTLDMEGNKIEGIQSTYENSKEKLSPFFDTDTHLISPLTTSEQLDDISSDLPFLDEDSESIFKTSSSSAPFWFPDEDILRISPDLKLGNPDRKYQKQSLATLLEERETENEESYQSLSDKYDNLTFLDANKFQNFVEIFDERKSNEKQRALQILELEQIDEVDFKKIETVIDPTEVRNEETLISENVFKEKLTEIKLGIPEFCFDEHDETKENKKVDVRAEIEIKKNNFEGVKEIGNFEKETNLKLEVEEKIFTINKINLKTEEKTRESEPNEGIVAEMPLQIDCQQKNDCSAELNSKPIEKDLPRIRDFSELSRRDFLLVSTGLSETMSLTFKADENQETFKAGDELKFQSQNVSAKSDPSNGMDLPLWSPDFDESKERCIYSTILFFIQALF